MIHPNVSDLPGLLVHVVLAVHNDVDHQPICVKSRQVGYPIKRFSLSIKELQLSVGKIGLKNLQNPLLAAYYHFGASLKAFIARSVSFERRQIKD